MNHRFPRAAVLSAVASALAAAHGCAEGSSSIGVGGGTPGGEGGGGGAPCETGLTLCEGLCFDTRTDPIHCGGCTTVCAEGQTCRDGVCAEPPCIPGVEEMCYSGPEGTAGVGVCASGVRVCSASGSEFGPCEGEVVPAPERCDTLEDEDCDGVVNNGCAYLSCAELPAGAASGIYSLDPDGAGPVEPFDAFCEMDIEGGGWTLVASYADGSYFRDTYCHISCDSNTQVGGCDERPFTTADTAGDVATRQSKDHKSRAYSTVPFQEFLFVDSAGRYASYEIASALQPSVTNWYPEGLRNWVGLNVEAHPRYSFPVKATNVLASSNNCNTLRLSFNVEDAESPIGSRCHESKKGPCWAKMENDACYWDEAGLSWVQGAFYRGSVSSYRLWLVR